MKTKAIYPGTFDPITLGHVNIAEKAAALFDEVIIAVADFTGKENLFTLKERITLCEQSVSHIKNVKVMSFKGLVVDFARAQKCRIMIRGMRAVSDFEYELSLALTNKKIAPEIETLFLVPSLRYMYLSSSMMKQLAELGGELADFVTPSVIQAFKKKFKHK
ncbi:MAG: pantetheine-phosphate adenylyltransferase [Candidatus Cloacimonadaceae bacterium]